MAFHFQFLELIPKLQCQLSWCYQSYTVLTWSCCVTVALLLPSTIWYKQLLRVSFQVTLPVTFANLSSSCKLASLPGGAVRSIHSSCEQTADFHWIALNVQSFVCGLFNFKFDLLSTHAHSPCINVKKKHDNENVSKTKQRIQNPYVNNAIQVDLVANKYK